MKLRAKCTTKARKMQTRILSLVKLVETQFKQKSSKPKISLTAEHPVPVCLPADQRKNWKFQGAAADCLFRCNAHRYSVEQDAPNPWISTRVFSAT